ncbi:MAG TPA: hypothetical protein VKA34_07115 [Balneolales bacterium]|nr:hypothetical protein [Balneolales bacterium]
MQNRSFAQYRHFRDFDIRKNAFGIISKRDESTLNSKEPPTLFQLPRN